MGVVNVKTDVSKRNGVNASPDSNRIEVLDPSAIVDQEFENIGIATENQAGQPSAATPASASTTEPKTVVSKAEPKKSTGSTGLSSILDDPDFAMAAESDDFDLYEDPDMFPDQGVPALDPSASGYKSVSSASGYEEAYEDPDLYEPSPNELYEEPATPIEKPVAKPAPKKQAKQPRQLKPEDITRPKTQQRQTASSAWQRAQEYGSTVGKTARDQEVANRISRIMSDVELPFDKVFPGSLPDQTPIYSRPDVSNLMFNEASKKVKETVSNSATFANNDNTAVSDYLMADWTINPAQLSIGHDILVMLAREPKTGFLNVLVKTTGMTAEEILDPANIDRLNKALRKSNKKFLFEKHPTTSTGDNIAVYLAVHPGRGVKCFPPMAKQFNADYDGDNARVILKYNSAKGLRSSMELLSLPGFKEGFDVDFFPFPNVSDTKNGNKKLNRILYDGKDEKGQPKYLKATKAQKEVLRKAINEKNFSLMGQAMMDIAESNRKTDKGVDWTVGEMIQRTYKIGNGEFHFCQEVYFGVPKPTSPVFEHEPTNEDSAKIMQWMQDVFAGKELATKYSLYKALGITGPKSAFGLKSKLGLDLHWIPGNNYVFRVDTDIAKYARKSNKFKLRDGYAVFSSEEDIENFVSGIASHHYARVMSEMADDIDIVDAQKAVIRERILRYDIYGNESPLDPRDSRFLKTRTVNHKEVVVIDWAAFARELFERAEVVTNMVDSSLVEFMSDYSVRQKKRWSFFKDKKTKGTLGNLLVMLYPNVAVEEFFPQGLFVDKVWSPELEAQYRACWEATKHLSIYDFCQQNRLYISTGQSDGGKSNPAHGTIDFSKNLYASDVFASIADHKHHAESDFSKAFDETCTEVAKANVLAANSLAKNHSKTPGVADILRSATEAMYMMGPDMFFDLGLHNPRAWVESEIGVMFLNAHTKEEVKNAYYIATVKHKTDKVNKKWTKYNELLENDNATEEQKQRARDEIEHMLDVMASSSPLWNVIAKDISTYGDVWRGANERLKGKSSLAVEDVYGFSHNMTFNWVPANRYGDTGYKQYWGNNQYSSILEMLADPNLPVKQKDAAVCDIIKEATGDIFNPASVPYLLTRDRSTIYGESRYANREGYSSLLTSMRQAKDIAARTYDRQKAIDKDVKAFTGSKDFDAAEVFVNYMQRVADGEPLVIITNEHYVEGMIAAGDKRYSDSEKGQKQKALTALYQGLSYAINGALLGHWDLINRFSIGHISASITQKNPLLLAQIISNPTKTFVVTEPGKATTVCWYDPNASEDVVQLCPDGNVSKWLNENSRIAMAFCKHTVNFSNDKDGGAYCLRTMSLAESVNYGCTNLDRAKFTLMNHPGFAGLIAGATPCKGYATRDVSINWAKNMDEVTKLVAYMALHGPTAMEYYKFAKRPETVSEEDWKQKTERINTHLIMYAGEIKQQFNGREAALAEIVQGWTPKDMTFFQDEESLRSAEECESKFIAAQTATGTGVNGNMDAQIVQATVWLKYQEDDCGAGTREVPREEILRNKKHYLGWKRADGTYLTQAELYKMEIEGAEGPAEQLYDPAECKCGCKSCRNHTPHDGSATLDGSKIQNVLLLAKQLIRTDSTEALNLKAEKVGLGEAIDMLSDRIVKYSLKSQFIDRDQVKMLKQVQSAYLKGGIADARRAMVPFLRDALSEYGYKIEDAEGNESFVEGFTDAQLTSLAHSFIREDEEAHSIAFVSPAETCDQINRRFDDEALLNYWKKGVSESELGSIMDNWVQFGDEGLGENLIPASRTGMDIQYVLRNVKVNGFFRKPEHLEMPHSASWKRNYERINDILSIPHKDFRGRDIDLVYSQSRVSELRDVVENSRSYHYNDKGKRELTDSDKAFLQFLDEYNIVGYMGSKKVKNAETGKMETKEDVRLNPQYMYPGPANAIYISGMIKGRNEKEFSTSAEFRLEKILETCQTHGVALALDAKHADEYLAMIQKLSTKPGHLPCSIAASAKKVKRYDGIVIIPFFDMALNGTSSPGNDPIMPVGMNRYEPNSFCVTCAETDRVHSDLGDSNVIATNSFAEKFKFSATKVHETKCADLFGTMLPGTAKNVEYGLIEDWNAMMLQTGQGLENLPPLDLGIYPTDEELERFGGDYSRWLAYIMSHPGDFKQRTGVYPGDIVGFAWCTWEFVDTDGKTKYGYAIAPVKPYERTDPQASWAMFDINGIEYNKETQSIDTVVKVDKPFEAGMFIKVYEDPHFANKGIIQSVIQSAAKIGDGTMIDLFQLFIATEGRRGNSLKKDLMSSLWTHVRRSRDWQYNMALSNDFLPCPVNPSAENYEQASARFAELRETMKTRPLEFDEWDEIRSYYPNGKIVFYTNVEPTDTWEPARVNVFLNDMFDKAFRLYINPSHLFASCFDGVPTDLHTVYGAFLENTEECQENFCMWMSKICPNSIPAKPGQDYSRCLARVGKTRGCIEFAVDYDGDGKIRWEPVFVNQSAFSEDASVLKRPSKTKHTNSASSVLNRIASGQGFKWNEIIQVARWGKRQKDGGYWTDADTLTADFDQDVANYINEAGIKVSREGRIKGSSVANTIGGGLQDGAW